MDFKEFIARTRISAGPIPPGIEERWQTRVLANGWHQWGEEGARAYLNRYGKGIGIEKVVHLALKAEQKGATDMAVGFWQKAFEMDGGKLAPSEREERKQTTTAPEPVKPAPKRKPVAEEPTVEIRRGPRQWV